MWFKPIITLKCCKLALSATEAASAPGDQWGLCSIPGVGYFWGATSAIPSQCSWFSSSSACSVSISLHAISNLAFTLESEILCSWWMSWCYQGRKGRAVVKLSFSCCAILLFQMLFLSCSPCRKWAAALTMLSTILCIHPAVARSHFALVFQHLSFLCAFLKFGTATLHLLGWFWTKGETVACSQSRLREGELRVPRCLRFLPVFVFCFMSSGSFAENRFLFWKKNTKSISHRKQEFKMLSGR